MTTDEKDFLSRWSRRKQSAREGLAEPEPEQPAVPAENTAEPAAEEAVEADESAYADIDFDALDYDSDYTRFMEKDVPEMVRRRALRALWRSDPILANVDGLNDYDEDFTDAALVVGNLVSAYRPGKGYVSEEDEAEAAQAVEAEEAPSEEPVPEHPPALAQTDEEPLDMEQADRVNVASDDGDPPKA